eukprot:412560-Amphidinium_carterae.1
MNEPLGSTKLQAKLLAPVLQNLFRPIGTRLMNDHVLVSARQQGHFQDVEPLLGLASEAGIRQELVRSMCNGSAIILDRCQQYSAVTLARLCSPFQGPPIVPYSSQDHLMVALETVCCPIERGLWQLGDAEEPSSH